MSNTECDRVKCVHNKMCNYLFELFDAQFTNVFDCNSYEEERPHGEWIPVSERMPNNHEYIKNNGLFNVSDGNRSYSEWFDIYETEKFGEPTPYGFRVDNAVIAWMPLPEVYKEEA